MSSDINLCLERMGAMSTGNGEHDVHFLVWPNSN